MYYCVFLLLTASYTPRRESNDLEHGVKVFPCAQRTAKTASALARLRRNWRKIGRRPQPLARGSANRSRAANDKILAATAFIGVRHLFLRRVPPDLLQYEKAKNWKLNLKKHTYIQTFSTSKKPRETQFLYARPATATHIHFSITHAHQLWTPANILWPRLMMSQSK